jgi:hypothetical protein
MEPDGAKILSPGFQEGFGEGMAWLFLNQINCGKAALRRSKTPAVS